MKKLKRNKDVVTVLQGFCTGCKAQQINFLCQPCYSLSLRTENDELPAELKVTPTEEPNSKVRLHVEVPPLVCEDSYKIVVAEFAKHAKVPGFCPGKKVPEKILVNHVGKRRVQRATVEFILRRTLSHAMSSVTGRALQDSVCIVTKFSEMEETYSSHGCLRYDVLVDVGLEVKRIPENGYKSLKIAVEIDSEIGAQSASEEQLRRCHKSIGSLRVVTDRGLEVGDVSVIDISATKIDHDESNIEDVPFAQRKGFHFDTGEGEKFLPGFIDAIIGIRPGDTRSFPLVFPETWGQDILRGVHAQFTVKCKELFFRDLPLLDNSIPHKLVPGCTTMEQVKEKLLKTCIKAEQTAREQATDKTILDVLSKMVEADIPQSLFEEQGWHLYATHLLEVQATNLNEMQFASLLNRKAVNEYLEHQKDSITNLIKQNLAVRDIYQGENLQCYTEDLVEEVVNSLAEFELESQKYDEQCVGLQSQECVEELVRQQIQEATVLEWLRENAEIQYVTR